MGDDDSECSRAAWRLGDLFAVIAVDDQWKEVESTAERLADALRTRGGPGTSVRNTPYTPRPSPLIMPCQSMSIQHWGERCFPRR